MKIDTLGIQAFVGIADLGSFSKAASSLHISQTALSRRLRNLEEMLGVKLIERTTRSVALTAIGSEFLSQAKRLTHELSMVLQDIRETGKTQRGEVRIACIPTAGMQFLPRIIGEYSVLYPHNRIKIIEQLSPVVNDAVLRREVEFGICVAEAQVDGLTSTAILRDEFALICRDDHPLARKRRVTWKELERHTLIFAEQSTANRALLDPTLEKHQLRLRSYHEVQRSSTAIGMVAEGVAAAIVPRLAVLTGTDPRVRVISLREPTLHRTVVLVTRKSASLSPAAQALYDLVRKRVVATASVSLRGRSKK